MQPCIILTMLRNFTLGVRILVFAALTFKTTISRAASVLSVDYGLSKVDYSPMSDYQVTPTGPNFGVSFGSRSGMMEPEIFFRSLSAEGDFIHDNAPNQFEHLQKTYGLALKFYLTKKFFFRFGYSISRVNQRIINEVDQAVADQITSTYQMVAQKTYNGPVYGVGYNFFDGKTFDIYSALSRTHILESGTELSVSAGIKFYFNLGISSVFKN